MRFIWNDLRISVRSLLKAPAFSVVVILTLGLGVGVNTTVFSVLNAVRFRHLPLPRAEDLVNVNGTRAGGPISYPDLLDYQVQTRAFTGLAAHDPMQFRFGGAMQSEVVWGEAVSANYFDTVQARAAVGRVFMPSDGESGPGYASAVISHSFWRTHFAGDPGVVGRQIYLHGNPVTVLGVAEAGFRGTFGDASMQLWVPLFGNPAGTPDRKRVIDNRQIATLAVVARLVPGVTLARAAGDLVRVAAQLDHERPLRSPRAPNVSLEPAGGVHVSYRSELLSRTTLLMAVVGTILLIAGANLSTLLLARADARARQFAVMLAIGGRRFHLIRYLFSEVMLLSICGAGVALLLAKWSLNGLMRLRPPIQRPIDLELTIDSRVFLFTLAAALLAAVIAGLAPAMRTARIDMIEALRGGPSASRRRVFGVIGMREFFVIAQVSACTVLLAVSGLFLAGFRNALTTDLGFDIGSTAVISPPNLRLWQYSEVQSRDFYNRVRERAANVPGVRSAALVRDVPLDIAFSQWRILGDSGDRGAAAEPMAVGANTVGPGYFATIGIPIKRGRDFDQQDHASSPLVAIVNSEFTHRLWPRQEAVGKRFVRVTAKGVGRPLEVVGVVPTGRYFSIAEAPRPFVFVPFEQNPVSDMRVIVQAPAAPSTIMKALEREILPIDPRLPTRIEPLRDAVKYAFWPARTGAVLFTIAGGLALALASIGLYGVMGYSVARRTAEIGLRMAIGASVRQVVTLVLLRCATLLIIGTALGWLCAEITLRSVRALVYGISPAQQWGVSLGAIVTVVTVGLLATLGPLRRALRIEPVTALRHE